MQYNDPQLITTAQPAMVMRDSGAHYLSERVSERSPPQVVMHQGIPNAKNVSVGCFQIPVLLQLPGTNNANLTLLAIAEARMQPSCYKLGETTIASRRSTDGGRSWDGLVFLGPHGDGGAMGGVWTR